MAAPLTETNFNDPVTQHMRRDVARLHGDQTVGEALAGMREQLPAGRIIYFYVVDADNRLQGVVPTRRLLLNPFDKPIADIMVRHVVAIPDRATVLDACEFFTLHRLLAFPVVDGQRHLLGVIDVELYTEEVSDVGAKGDLPPVGDDLFQLVGVHLAQARQTSPWQAFRSRFPWLLCNIAGGILAAFLSGLYEAELRKVVALALFVPVVLALAESVSIQSVSLALQVLHTRVPTWRAMLHRMVRELGTGLLLGAASGLFVSLVAWAWLGDVSFVLCLWGGIAGGVTGAAVFGLGMPNLLRLLKRDPHFAAGPIALTLSDMFTLLIYFNLARWLFAERFHP